MGNKEEVPQAGWQQSWAVQWAWGLPVLMRSSWTPLPSQSWPVLHHHCRTWVWPSFVVPSTKAAPSCSRPGCAQDSTPNLILPPFHPAPHRQPATPKLSNLPWLPGAREALRPGLGGGERGLSNPGSIRTVAWGSYTSFLASCASVSPSVQGGEITHLPGLLETQVHVWEAPGPC